MSHTHTHPPPPPLFLPRHPLSGLTQFDDKKGDKHRQGACLKRPSVQETPAAPTAAASAKYSGATIGAAIYILCMKWISIKGIVWLPQFQNCRCKNISVPINICVPGRAFEGGFTCATCPSVYTACTLRPLSCFPRNLG